MPLRAACQSLMRASHFLFDFVGGAFLAGDVDDFDAFRFGVFGFAGWVAVVGVVAWVDAFLGCAGEGAPA